MVHFRPYETMRERWCRGVFHGADPSDSPEGLLAELSCPTHKILAARHMDGEGRTVMITVDGSTLPKEALYRLHLKKVFPFQVRAILCTRCHQLGHQHDVCPAAQAVCACGRPLHRHEIDGCHEPHQCALCGGSHLATDGTCPKVKQATAQRRTRWAPPPQRKARQQRRTLQAKPPPPPFAKDHGDLETIWPPLRPVMQTKPPHETTTLPRVQACVQVMPRRIPPPRPPPPSSESIARARADTTRSQQRPQRTQGVQTTLAADDQPATPLTGRPSDPFGPGLTVLQWNCRSYRQHGPKLKRRLAASAHPPDIILLQEARVSEPNIVGYRAFSTPTIIVAQKGPRRKRDAQGNISVPQAHAHVLLKKSIPAAQLDTSCYCSEQREVTAVSARLRDKDIVVVSVYWRPHSTTNDEDAEWLKLLCTRTIHPLPVLIGGDFNAHHTSWGSKSNTVRGRSVADNALVAGLVLANSPDAVTRRADSQQQDSTSPDVTWYSPSLRCSWAVVDDTWGSDHFPVIIGLGGKSRALATRTVSTTRWDDFREVLAELPPHEPLFNRIIPAQEIVTRSVKVSAEAPTPDQHLLNLWESRIKAQHCYLEGGKLPPDRARFNCASAEAKRFSLELLRKEWHDHCTSFNGRTSTAKVWATMRGMTRTNVNKQLEKTWPSGWQSPMKNSQAKLAPYFFHRNVQRVMTQPRLDFHSLHLNNPWTQLQGALFSITKLHGAPGPDMITVPALRNLPEAAMQELLDIFNESWELGQLPAIWRHALVIPIPKPGRTPKQLTDMRPISLTSHVGKLMERMALMRLEWHIEANNVLHPCQTGFRRGLSTQDSLALFAEDLAGKHPRYDIKIAVAIDVKKAFDSVPHPTVIAAASAAGLTGKPLQYIRAFLNGRTYTRSPTRRGAFSATLQPSDGGFEPPLDKIPGIRHTIYANDVTIWTTGGPVGPQNDSAQEALDIVAGFLIERGLTPSPDKTQYAVFGNTNARREATPCIELKFGGTVITATNVLRVLGVDFSAHGPPVTWLSKTKASVVHMLHLIRRTTAKDWGADTHTLRMLVRSLIQAKILYGAQHVGITRKQREALEVLNRRAMRIVTGLPNFTPVDTLQAHAGLNTIGDLLHEACLGQHIRLSRSRPGRSILGLLGLRPVEGVSPPAIPPPPWSLPCLTSGKPTPSHAGGGHPGRRRFQAAAHERDVNADGPEAELRAILLGAELALHDTATGGLSPTEILLHTDSAEAVKACLSSAPPRSPTVCSIRAAVVGLELVLGLAAHIRVVC
ncbi:hypothetical protein HPB47_015323 [Ixodes persulcatus]|uniref:Uncharacterized protein n=1 Tax=Ixodes persulcatus TaxID=34615 RepID=A0AC60QTZ1_IXOPE|nr:hypothetical protein HPB47_015323 [Ixodes persulcatus]